MHFCSLAYVLFFTLLFSAYWLIPSKNLRNYLLLAASFYFYASWNSWLAILVVASSTFDFALALNIENQQSVLKRKVLLAISITANLSLLCYFKYVNFFLDSVKEALLSFGMETHLPILSVILPVGISF